MRRFARTRTSLALSVFFFAFTHTAFGQDGGRPLPAGQSVEREIAGAQAHRYRVELRAKEFFQAHLEQKGVDVTLRLLDAAGAAVATMDSPNGKQGPETLSFFAERRGSFVLEVGAPDAKAEKGVYSLRRGDVRPATPKDRRRVEVERLFVEGMAARSVQGQAETAVAKLEEAVKGWRELGDSYLADLTERQVKAVRLQPKINALIADFNAPQNLVAEGQKLMREGKPESVLAARAKFTEAAAASRTFFKRLGDGSLDDILSKENRADWKALIKINEVNALGGVGTTYSLSKDWEESVSYGEQAVAVIREMSEDSEISASGTLTSFIPLKAFEASSLNAVCSTLTSRLNKPREGLSRADRALTLWREVQREHEKYRAYAEFGEAMTLQTAAQSYLALDDRDKAVESFERALKIFRGLPDQKGLAASVLSQIGDIHSRQLDYGKARAAWGEALKIYEELGDKPSQAGVLQQIGISHLSVNDEQKSREYLNRALAILLSDDYLESALKEGANIPLPDSKVGRLNLTVFQRNEREWERLIGAGNIYVTLGDNEKAREYFEKSLAPARATNNQNQVRLSLFHVGSTYEAQKRWPEALDYYSRELEISRRLPGKSDLAGDLCDVAAIQLEMKNWPDALRNASEALLIYQSLGADKNTLFLGYSGALNLLARAQDGLGNRRLAIFYEKQAVNAKQRERQRLRDLDGQAQRGYLKKNEKPYRRLADWLVAEGRLPEAEQVLAMLKEEEVFDYLRRDASESDKLQQRADLRPEERDALKRYNEIADKVAALGAEFGDLQELQSKGVELDAGQKKRHSELTAQIEDASRAFQVFLRQLADEFARRPRVEEELQENLALQSDLKEWGPGVVFLYTLAGEDRYRVILVTPDTQADGKAEVKASDLNDKIERFRAAVQNPTADPRPLGKELYDILIKPIEKQLDGAKAKTLLWSLDGSLRLLPLAALWDGRQYFGQKYQSVTVTLASRPRLGERAGASWRALGLGVSEARSVKEPSGTRDIPFEALPAVRTELRSIIRSAESPDGILPGQSLLDAEFNEPALESQLLRGYNVVHIASHFSLNPGDASRSFLLMGDGDVLTVDEMKNNPRLIFRGVELLTLSACQTAVVGKDGSGREVEGFGYVAQKKGAKAILATLWSVADESTQLLMSEFYRLRKEKPQLTKAEALRLAQGAMLDGKLSASGAREAPRGLKLGKQAEPNPGLPKFPFDRSKPYAHPYFWSPFVLIGNWR